MTRIADGGAERGSHDASRDADQWGEREQEEQPDQDSPEQAAEASPATAWWAGVGDMKPDGAARRHHERFDEVGQQAKALVYPATMPATAGTTRTKDARAPTAAEARKPVSSGCWLPGP